MKYLIFAIMAMGVSGCSWLSSPTVAPVVCAVEQPAENAIAAGIQSATGCSSLSGILASVVAEATSLKINFCPVTTSANKKSIIGDTICGPLLAGLQGGVLAKIPPAWGTCTGGPILASGIASLTTICQNAL